MKSVKCIIVLALALLAFAAPAEAVEGTSLNSPATIAIDLATSASLNAGGYSELQINGGATDYISDEDLGNVIYMVIVYSQSATDVAVGRVGFFSSDPNVQQINGDAGEGANPDAVLGPSTDRTIVTVVEGHPVFIRPGKDKIWMARFSETASTFIRVIALRVTALQPPT